MQYELTKNGVQSQINDVLAYTNEYSFKIFNSLSRIFKMCSVKLGSHAYNLSIWIQKIDE